MSDYEKLQQLIADADAMTKKNITNDAAEFKAWETGVKRFLYRLFGEDSLEMKAFLEISFFSGVWSFDESDEAINKEAVFSCRNGLNQAIAILKSFVDDVAEDQPTAIKNPSDCSKVFIVHGHDGELKESVARIIEKQGISAIILSEQANQGRTIIEKFEDYSDVGGAICLFTADDFGRSKNEDTDQNRARQNVVFETGFFMGSLGRKRVIILADSGIEVPSDLSGVVYTSTANWQFDLLKELNAMGYSIDLNKLL